MQLPTPIQADEVENYEGDFIRDNFSEYESTFIILHPFLKINHHTQIKFERGNWPSKKDILKHTSKLTWTEIIKEAKLKDICELDRLLAFLHCARRTADKEAWIKLMTIVDTNKYVVPQVDVFPEILINPTLEFLKSIGYDNVVIYSLINENKMTYKIQDLIESENDLPEVVPIILTPDNRIRFEMYFDLSFTYLSGDKHTIDAMVEMANLEGFYCNVATKPYWSQIDEKGILIDWESEERHKNYAKID